MLCRIRLTSTICRVHIIDENWCCFSFQGVCVYEVYTMIILRHLHTDFPCVVWYPPVGETRRIATAYQSRISVMATLCDLFTQSRSLLSIFIFHKQIR